MQNGEAKKNKKNFKKPLDRVLKVCYNKAYLKRGKAQRRKTTMKNYTVEHKHNGAVKHIKGFDIWDALKKNALDGKVWIIAKEQ